MKSKKSPFSILLLFIAIVSFAQKQTPITIGQSIEFQSVVLNEKRQLNVYLPQGYSPDSTRRYPVIYLLDGSMDEDFIHIAGLVQFGSFSWINMLPESIVVGIANVDRRRDFTFPTRNEKDKKNNPTSGSSSLFIEFLEKDVQPLIAKTFKIDTPRTLIGQSLGGLLATEILFKKPELFDNYIIISPSLWWDDESLLQYTPSVFSSKKSIYIGVGKEGEIMERDAADLYKKLTALNRSNTTLNFNFFEKLSHGDALHLAVYEAFGKIFKH
jgi:uncharacterized protein